VVRRKPLRFDVTPKIGPRRRSLGLAAPHLALLAATAAGIAYRASRLSAGAAPGDVAAFASNVLWSLHNALCFAPFVLAALALRRRAPVERTRTFRARPAEVAP
jgi:cellulose synthase (UDP-forming)